MEARAATQYLLDSFVELFAAYFFLLFVLRLGWLLHFFVERFCFVWLKQCCLICFGFRFVILWFCFVTACCLEMLDVI